MYIQSKEVLDSEGRQYHIKCKKGDVGRYVLLPGDPFRTDIIARHLDNPQLVAHNREHKSGPAPCWVKRSPWPAPHGLPLHRHRRGRADPLRRGVHHPGGHLRQGVRRQL